MTPDEQAFLVSIAADLTDDTKRLAYADWLQDTKPNSTQADHDRAEFIRIQISLATGFDYASNIPGNRGKLLTPEVAVTFAAPENELLDLHRDAWEARIRQDLPNSCIDVTFHRGFPTYVTVNGPHELVTSRILEADADTNTLTGLRVTNLGHNLPELLAYEGIAKLTTLDLGYNNLGDEGAIYLADSPHLARLRTLGLSVNHIGNEGARAIADSPYLTQLTTLYLRHNNIRPAGARAIAASPHFVNLIMLDLWDNGIGDEGLAALARSPYLTNLITLDLGHNNIGDAGAAILIGATLPLPAKSYALRTIGHKMLADQVERNARGPSGGDANPHEPPAKRRAVREGLSDGMNPNPDKPTRKGYVR
jgi:uncharacterized protein (TIGR02996 family)